MAIASKTLNINQSSNVCMKLQRGWNNSDQYHLLNSSLLWFFDLRFHSYKIYYFPAGWMKRIFMLTRMTFYVTPKFQPFCPAKPVCHWLLFSVFLCMVHNILGMQTKVLQTLKEQYLHFSRHWIRAVFCLEETQHRMATSMVITLPSPRYKRKPKLRKMWRQINM